MTGRVLAMVGIAAVVVAGALPVVPAAAQSGAVRAHAGGNASDGQAVFQHACVMCHAVQPGVTIVGPSLASVMRGPHALSLHAAEQIILNGKGKMPAERDKLSNQEIADVLAYLKTL